MAYCKDMSGLRFGKLLVIKSTGEKTKSHNAIWECLCDCGNTCYVAQGSLAKGGTTSCGCNRIRPKGEASFTALYKRYMIRAKERNLCFELSEDEFRCLTVQNCFYCDCEPKHKFGNKKGNGLYTYNGVDRFNNKDGYTVENCVPCCGDCNRRKNDSDSTEFLDWIKRVHINVFEKDNIRHDE